ncbi:uncharacterized protein PHALS_01304 [Plasmopara halstedii]|uniref:Uncharacterized protein n=1 Tax=Plasmopara halstedii TaxID=4781 RepID=A0A0P1AUE1_PLAHL|nr:uncharacterized protein PHALS_01304 [Plasmopara halstedii]CEG44981.1 hypothetical protein PHALS_01304 [Plasmopara halstedii]|eukprot:XP_024581350.1 hypothetical protein PHALS_01304 [Plasmopara halstedii]
MPSINHRPTICLTCKWAVLFRDNGGRLCSEFRRVANTDTIFTNALTETQLGRLD